MEVLSSILRQCTFYDSRDFQTGTSLVPCHLIVQIQVPVDFFSKLECKKLDYDQDNLHCVYFFLTKKVSTTFRPSAMIN